MPSGWPRSYVNWVTSRNQRDASPSTKALLRYQSAIGSFGRAIDTSVKGTQGETTGTVPRTVPQDREFRRYSPRFARTFRDNRRSLTEARPSVPRSRPSQYQDIQPTNRHIFAIYSTTKRSQGCTDRVGLIDRVGRIDDGNGVQNDGPRSTSSQGEIDRSNPI